MYPMNDDLINRDQQARKQALDVSQSFIVQAPAGSGKTELIIQRFLRLLNLVNRPEEILAITFTKKAANEMRHRIIRALNDAHATSVPPDAPHAKLTWQLARAVLKRDQEYQWRLIDNPNQLHLHTIDALCSFLTKQLPLLSHFGSTPDIDINPGMLYREAAENTLHHLEGKDSWSNDLANLLLHLDNDINKLQTLLIKLFSKRDQWLPYLHWESDDGDVRRILENNFQAVIHEHLVLLHQLFPKNIQAELIAILHYAANQLTLSQNNAHPEIIACLDIHTLPKANFETLPYWLGIAKLCLTTEGAWRKSFDVRIGFPAASHAKNAQEKKLYAEYKTRIAALVSSLNEHEQLRNALSELYLLPNPHYANDQWDILISLFKILKLGAAELRLTFERHGRIDFIENAQAALLALGNDDHPTDLALLLDYRIQHILIDEFQDTSFNQFQLLEKLIYGWQPDDGRTLFVVGDPTQSIYRFRQAEVGLFMRMWESGIGQIALTPLTLAVNFRSTPQIVTWNNQQFSSLFPSYQDIAKGAVTYNPCVAHQKENVNGGDSNVMMQGFVNCSDMESIKAIIHQIKQTKNNFPKDNIAVLVRSRSHLSLLIAELKKAKINYRAIDIDPLATRQVIQDLLSLTSAMHHLADRIAWLSVLRAPWCGLTLTALHAIAHADPKASIWEQCENALSHLKADDQKRLIRVMTILKSKIDERARYDLRTWIESTWLLLGGPASLLDEKDLEDAHAFFSLLTECHQDFEKFSLERLKEKIATLYAPVTVDDHTLQIMTIHSAKGLEFDTVILPHLERKTPNDEKPLLAWMERSIHHSKALLLAPIHATGFNTDAIYEYIHYQQKIKADYETDRLLYVAATRAKKRLYLFFNITQNEDNEYKTEKGSFLNKLWPILKNQANEWRANMDKPSITNSPEEKERQPKVLLRLSSDWQNPIQEIAITKIATHLDPQGFRLVNEDTKHLGIVIHAVLQNLAERGIAWWQKQNKNSQIEYLHHHLQQQNILPEHLEKNIMMAFNAIQNTLNDERGQWILKAHPSAHSEYAITALIKNEPMSFIIDRTFIDEDGVRWIIDYKTTTFSDDDLNEFLKKEQQKYLQKMKFYQEAMRALDDRPTHLGLYFPALPAWYAWK